MQDHNLQSHLHRLLCFRVFSYCTRMFTYPVGTAVRTWFMQVPMATASCFCPPKELSRKGVRWTRDSLIAPGVGRVLV